MAASCTRAIFCRGQEVKRAVQRSRSRLVPPSPTRLASSWRLCAGTAICIGTARTNICAGPCRQACVRYVMLCTRRCASTPRTRAREAARRVSVRAARWQALPVLSEASKALGPPSSCELLFHYRALDTAVGRHRDVFTSADLAAYYERGFDPLASDQWGQAKCTDVLIYSHGNTSMEMGLSFPVKKRHARDRDSYEQPPGLRIPLSPGTLLVYKFLDDLFFCHEARFREQRPSDSPGEAALYRVAFVFRWLSESEERLYYVDPARGGRHAPSAADVARWKKTKKRKADTW